jgi:hypothetical protein
MPEQLPAVTISHPPAALLKVVNPVLRFALRTPLLGAPGKELMVLSFNGRKSGKRYSIPLSAHHLDGTLYALIGAPWKVNFRDGAAADVLHQRTTTAMRGELIRDTPVVADLYHRLAELYGPTRAQRSMGLSFRDDATPTLDDFTTAVEVNGLAAIKLTPAG